MVPKLKVDQGLVQVVIGAFLVWPIAERRVQQDVCHRLAEEFYGSSCHELLARSGCVERPLPVGRRNYGPGAATVALRPLAVIRTEVHARYVYRFLE